MLPVKEYPVLRGKRREKGLFLIREEEKRRREGKGFSLKKKGRADGFCRPWKEKGGQNPRRGKKGGGEDPRRERERKRKGKNSNPKHPPNQRRGEDARSTSGGALGQTQEAESLYRRRKKVLS